MSVMPAQATLHFSPALRDWILQGLAAGQAPAALVEMLVSRQYDRRAAQGLVGAFHAAVARGETILANHITVSVPDGAAPTSSTTSTSAPAARLPEGNVLDGGDRQVRVVTRLRAPRIAVLENVLDEAECQALVDMARPRLARSTTTDLDTGDTVATSGRTSAGMFFRLEENPLVARLDRRFARLMGMPTDHGEGLQVLHYPAHVGQVSPHFDFLMPTNETNRASIARSGQRVSTLVVYLNDVEAGGDTTFPELGLSVAARRGNAVYFEYCDEAGQLDGRTLHAGAPVSAGSKWVVTKWMRQRRFVPAGAADVPVSMQNP